MKKIHPSSKQYGYAFLVQFSGVILMMVFLGIAVFLLNGSMRVGPADAALRTPAALMGLFFLLAAGLTAYMGVGSFFGYSSLDISDEGITAYKWSWKLKTIRWQDIKKIKQVRFWNPKGYKYSMKFSLYDADQRWLDFVLQNLKGPIIFTNSIHNLDGLVERINSYTKEYGIPLYVLDREKGRTEQQVTKF